MTLSLNEKSQNIQIRSQILNHIRSWFQERGFLEVSTPSLTAYTCPEPNLYPIKVTIQNINQSKHPGHLILSPELCLKKLLANGYDQIYEIAKCFRNKEFFHSPHHNIEFTLLEWYRKNCNYDTTIEDCKDLITSLVNQYTDSQIYYYQNQSIDLSHWETKSISKLFKEFANISLDNLDSWDDLISIAKHKKLGLFAEANEAFSALFAHFINKHLIEAKYPIILKDYPYFQGSLAKPAADKRYCERFEIYLAGIELANGYSELCDPKEMEKRFNQFILWHNHKHGTSYEIDREFIDSLHFVQSASGVALGIERLNMLLANAKDIDEVILFPIKSMFDSAKKSTAS